MRSTIAASLCAATLTAGAFAQGITLDTLFIATGITYPTCITHAPGDESRLFVCDKRGYIRIIDLTTNTLLTTNYLNIDSISGGGTSVGSEQGLLGLAFHPDYATNGYFFVNYTNTAGSTVIARYQVSADPNVANASSALQVMTWTQPYTNHNGGWIEFSPSDGHMYIGTGDGGSANDPGGTAQDITAQRLGKLLRIDPNVAGTTPPYTIPSDNPFVGVTGDDEIWAYGMRNPWRCAFDRVTGDLYIGDVGQNAVEEIDYQAYNAAGGRNYGWRCKEGNSSTGLTGCTPSDPSLTNPIVTHNHTSGTNGGYSITGGRLYRGCAIPELQGYYIYADYVAGNFWSLKVVNGVATEVTSRTSQLGTAAGAQAVNQMSAFGEDANGEMYVADHGGGIYKIINVTGDVSCEPPCIGIDLNCDGLIDGVDLGILLAGWGGAGGDTNDDGTTDGVDLGALLAGWGV